MKPWHQGIRSTGRPAILSPAAAKVPTACHADITVMRDIDWNQGVWSCQTSLEPEGDQAKAGFCREAEARHVRRLGLAAQSPTTARGIRAADNHALRLGVFGRA